MRLTRRLTLVTTLCLLMGAGCVPSLPTGTTGNKPKPGESKKPSASPSATASTPPSLKPSASPSASLAPAQIPAGFLTAQVLGLDGKPAGGVPIKSYVISTGGGNVISTGGGNVISTGGGNVISTGGGNYVLLQAAADVKTDAEGKFYFKPLADGNKLTVEAVQSETVKALQMEIGAQTSNLTMKLAKTGAISGKVTAPEAPSVTNFENVDVFIPGTSYAAKTDAAGNFTITNVPVGAFNVVALKDNLGRANATNVTVESEKTAAVSSLALSIKAPSITKVTPDVAGPGVEVSITGENFGATDGKTFQVTFGGVIAADPTRVDDKTLKVKVPGAVGNGNVIVAVGGITSNGSAFKVIKSLSVAANPAELVRNRTYTFTVTGKDTADQDLVNPPVTWSATGTGLTVDATGKVKGTADGAGTVKATSGTIEDVRNVQVSESLFEVSTFAGGPTSNLGIPQALAFGQDDHLYVSDSSKHVIWRISPQGTMTIFAGVLNSQGHAEGARAEAKFNMPMGLGFDGAGNLYVADNGNNRIRKIATDGTVSTIFGDGVPMSETIGGPITEEMSCNNPIGLKVDGTNNIYFTERQSSRTIRKITPANELQIQIASTYPTAYQNESVLHWPDLVKNNTTLIVPENATGSTYSRLYKIDGDTATLLAGGLNQGTAVDGTGAAAGFGAITGIGLDNDGNYFITEYSIATQSHLIRRITPAGVVTTVAGNGNGMQDGVGKAAKFQSPNDIVLGPDGNLYVADGGNGRIRKLTPIQAE